jgi:hypothetical protein
MSFYDFPDIFLHKKSGDYANWVLPTHAQMPRTGAAKFDHGMGSLRPLSTDSL